MCVLLGCSLKRERERGERETATTTAVGLVALFARQCNVGLFPPSLLHAIHPLMLLPFPRPCYTVCVRTTPDHPAFVNPAEYSMKAQGRRRGSLSPIFSLPSVRKFPFSPSPSPTPLILRSLLGELLNSRYLQPFREGPLLPLLPGMRITHINGRVINGSGQGYKLYYTNMDGRRRYKCRAPTNH